MATSPAEAAGVVTVTVTTAEATSATSTADLFTFEKATTQPFYTKRTTVTRNTSGTTLTITTHDVGDVVVVYAMTTTLAGASRVASISDSNDRVTWQSAPVVAHTDTTHTVRQEIWYGRVTSVGSTEIVVHWTGTPGGGKKTYAFQVGSSNGSAALWGVAASGSKQDPDGPVTGGFTYPDLKSGLNGGFYVGFAISTAATPPSGAPSGFTFSTSAERTGSCFDTDLAVATTYSPIQAQASTSSSWDDQIAAIFQTSDGVTPTVSSVSPSAGAARGGTSVTVTGTGLSAATSVDFGSTAATNLAEVSTTEVTATSPVHAPGTVTVTVTTPEGTSATSTADRFTFETLPSYTTRTTVTHNTSGTTLTITTRDVGDIVVVYAQTTTLTGAVQVSSISDSNSLVTWQTSPVVAHTAATYAERQEIWYGRVTAVGSTEITVHWTGTPGRNVQQTFAVQVGSSNGTSGVWGVASSGTTQDPTGPTTEEFSYPTLKSGTDGGFYVGFAAANVWTPPRGTPSAFIFGSYTHGSGSCLDTGLLASTTYSPQQAQGAPTPDDQIAAIFQTTYGIAPTVSSLSPSAGPTAGGTPVTITGTGLADATAADFGSTPATNLTVVSTGKITVTSPALAAGVMTVKVTSGGKTSTSTVADKYHYLGRPTVLRISPTSGPATGGTTVTIVGANFVPGASVHFGATAGSSVTVHSSTLVTVTAPAHAAGAATITVSTSGGTSATRPADQFTY